MTSQIIRHVNRVTGKPRRIIREDGRPGYRTAAAARAAAGRARYDRDTRTEAASGKTA